MIQLRKRNSLPVISNGMEDKLSLTLSPTNYAVHLDMYNMTQAKGGKAPVKKSKWAECKGSLGPNFVPGPNDVICARGQHVWNHIGNKRFRSIVAQYCERYKNVSSKYERTNIVTEIVEVVRSQGNGFVKFDEERGEWAEAGNMVAREKVGQYFRSSLGYKSSFKLKKDRLKITSKRNSDKVLQIVRGNDNVRQAIDTMQSQYQQVKALPDADVLDFFSQHNRAMLQLMKQDTTLVGKFQAAMSESDQEQSTSDR